MYRFEIYPPKNLSLDHYQILADRYANSIRLVETKSAPYLYNNIPVNGVEIKKMVQFCPINRATL